MIGRWTPIILCVFRWVFATNVIWADGNSLEDNVLFFVINEIGTQSTYLDNQMSTPWDCNVSTTEYDTIIGNTNTQSFENKLIMCQP